MLSGAIKRKDLQMANNDNRFTNDPYERKYQEQLEEFNRLANEGSTSSQADYQARGMDTSFTDNGTGYYDGHEEYPQYNGYGQSGVYGQNDVYGQYDAYGQNDVYGQYDAYGQDHAYAQNGGYGRGMNDRDNYNYSNNGYSGERRPRSSANSRPRRRSSEHVNYNRDQLYFGSNSPQGRRPQPQRKRPAREYYDDEDEPQRRTREAYEEQAHREARKKKKSPLGAFFKTIFVLALIVFLIFNIIILRYILAVKIKPDKARTYNGASMHDKKVQNILLIGSDTRSAEEYGRTDTMILLSVDSKKKQVTMTSFMRDMYVNICGRDTDGNEVNVWDKLNSAYVRGGPELLLDTIEYNFDIDVDDYVYVDFFSFVDIVDSIGGIEVEVTEEEAYGMQPPMAEQNKILGREWGSDYLYEGGRFNMNGNQALAYARLRYVGNADFQRTERQREVIGKIIDKVKHSDPLTIDKFLRTTLGHLTTNMSVGDMYLSSYKALFAAGYDIRSLRLPAEGNYSYGEHDGQSTLDIDLEACRELLRSEIYG